MAAEWRVRVSDGAVEGDGDTLEVPHFFVARMQSAPSVGFAYENGGVVIREGCTMSMASFTDGYIGCRT
eukprot:699081-Amphidinium_carterae.1